jgi:hypothetical protein
MSSISAIGPSNWSQPGREAPGIASVYTNTESVQSALTLKLRTAEGDTVELSFDETSRKRLESGTAQSAQDTATYTRTKESDTIHFKIKIKGSLNDQEVSDITKLIQSLESGQPSTSPLSSLTAYSGSFQQDVSESESGGSRVTL